MSREGSVEVEGLWKRFRPDRRRPSVLYDGWSIFRQLRGREWSWALRDVSFSITPGSAIGIIGLNGSGKTTLLRILYGVMFPTAGRVTITGRQGALIDVDAGMHPQLSGRENIHLWGAMLGLRRSQVLARFDDIVEFADIGDSLERQSKFYSSGMRMRLGFAVAATLDPDILLVDEVLAVGDEVFQRRCLDRLRSLHASGTTVIYVSHDLATVAPLCERVIWLAQGSVVADGDAATVVEDYRRASDGAIDAIADDDVLVEMQVDGEARSGAPASFIVQLRSETDQSVDVTMGIGDGRGQPILTSRVQHRLVAGVTSLACDIPELRLPPGRYRLWVSIAADGRQVIEWQPRSWLTIGGVPVPVGTTFASVDARATWRVVDRQG